MKILFVRKVLHGLAVVLPVVGAWTAGADEIHPDWADLVQKATSQDIYVPNDATWVIQGDEDLDIIDGGAKRIRFAGNGKVVLDGTTRYFAKLHSDSTTCEIIKRGTSTTTHTGSGRSFNTYNGTLTIASRGQSEKTCFGCETKNGGVARTKVRVPFSLDVSMDQRRGTRPAAGPSGSPAVLGRVAVRVS